MKSIEYPSLIDLNLLKVDEDKISRIKEVPDDLKEILLNADYCINLSIGKLPNGPLDEYIKTGMKWD